MTESRKSPSSGLRPARVFATAFAALTGAFLASQLGVYGTVIGAGLFSFMTTIGTEFYVRSLDRTKVAAKQARVAALARTGRVPAQNGTGEPGLVTPPTAVLPMDDQTTLYFRPPVSPPPATARPPMTAPAPPPRGRIRWAIVGGVTALAFGLGMLTVTGIEAVTGKSISGGEGTTAGRVITGNDNAEQPPATTEPAPSETTTQPPTSEETTAPSATETASETEGPLQPSESDEPSESDDPSDEPTSTRPPLLGR